MSETNNSNDRVKRVAIGADHGAFATKEMLKTYLQTLGYTVTDTGTFDATTKVDYPDFAVAVAKKVTSGECDRGIICCGTGVGISLAANKIKGIRCVVCSDCYSAMLSRQHNDTNMLSMGARVVGTELAKMIARIWLTTDFEGGRHQRRVDMITEIEKSNS